MSWTLPLPDHPDELAIACEQLVKAGLEENRKHLIEWLQCEYFLKGIRSASFIYSPQDYIQATYDDETGRRHLRLEYALQKYQVEKGRLGGMNLAPRIGPSGYGLGALRNASIGQALLEYLISPQQAERAKQNVIPLILKASMVGVGGWIRRVGDRTFGELEIIHPKELLPLPAYAEQGDEAQGLIRHREVPLEYLKKQTDLKVPRDATLEALQGFYLEYGRVPDTTIYQTYTEQPLTGSASILQPMPWSRGQRTKVDKTKDADLKAVPYVRLDEIWLYGPDMTVSRYIARAGSRILADVDYEKAGERVPMPIGIARYNDIGDFYGRTFLYPLISLNREIENAYRTLFQLVEDADWLGLLLIPTTIGLTERELKQTSKPKVAWYEPTWDAPGAEPKQMQPANLGMFPAQVASTAVDMLDRISGQSELYQGGAPGRADSAAAFQAITEAGNTGIRSPIESLGSAFTQAYQHILYKAKQGMPQGETFHVRSIDSDIIGVVVDPREGTISLADNPIPDPWSVEVGVESKEPKSRAQRILELSEELQKQIITPTDYRLTNYRERLNLPVGSKAEWETYRMTMFNIRLLFRDGKTPGVALMQPANDQVNVALIALNDFMASPEFALSEAPVRNAFKKLKDAYRAQLGSYPDALPFPEEIGEEGQEGQQGPGGPAGLPEGA